MTDIEDRLRAELRAAASRVQPWQLRELHVPAGRRGGARWLAPAAALVAIGLVAAIIGVVASHRPGSGPASGSTSPAPSSTPAAGKTMPRFYVAASVGEATRLVAAASATGAVTDTLTALPDVPGVVPPTEPDFTVVGLVAAAADDRTFVISVHRMQLDAASATITLFYRATLTPAGKLTRLRKLPLTIQPGAPRYQADAMALSPDGRTLAVAVAEAPGYQAQGRQTAGAHAAIEVVSLRTGAVRTWSAPALTALQDLSWVSGTKLGFSLGSAGPGASPGYQVRVLDTAGPAGELASRSRPVALATSGPILSALVTGNGHVVAAFTSDDPGQFEGVILAEFSARTGRRLRVLTRLPGDAQAGGSLTVLSADPTGQHLLIGGIEVTPELPEVAGGRVFGRVDNGRFTPLPDPVDLQPEFAAW